MGKLHKIRRLLRDPEQRKVAERYSIGAWVSKGRSPRLTYRNSHRNFIKKILREYLAA